MFFPLAIIIVGAILLLENLNIITGDIWDWVWPALIIVLGLSMMFKRNRRRQLTNNFNPATKPKTDNQAAPDKVEEAEYEEKNK